MKRKDRFGQVLARRDARRKRMYYWGRHKDADLFFRRVGWEEGVKIMEAYRHEWEVRPAALQAKRRQPSEY